MDAQLKIVIGCDLAAYDFKLTLIEILRARGYNLTDVGCFSSKSGDYPYYGRLVGEKVVSGEFDRGIVMCGTGQGICIAANKVKGVRAALCTDLLPALLSREHNNSNVLAMGAWQVTPEHAARIAETWLFAKFAGGRHEIRVNMLTDIENGVPFPPPEVKK